MNNILLLLLPAFLFFAPAESQAQGNAPVKIRMSFEGREVVVAMFDCPASRDFLTMLPLEAEFKDFAGKEKVAYLPRKLNTADSPTANTTAGDFAYYAPWGNLAVFYKGFGSNGQLYTLGTMESGKEALAGMHGDFTARIEKID